MVIWFCFGLDDFFLTGVVGDILMFVVIIVIGCVVIISVAVSFFGIVSGAIDGGFVNLLLVALSLVPLLSWNLRNLVGILVESVGLSGSGIFYLLLLS